MLPCTCALSSYSQNALIPDIHREPIVSHFVMVHQSVGKFSMDFQQKLRRNNYVTPKNYLDFIKTYLKLLEEKDKYILGQVGFSRQQVYVYDCSKAQTNE